MRPLCLLFFLLFLGNSWAQRKKDKATAIDPEKQKVERLALEALITDGMRFMAMEDLTRADSAFNEALRMSPDLAAAQYQLAEIRIKQEKLDQALAFSQSAYKAAPDNKYYLLQLAQIFEDLHKYSEAAKLYEDLIAKSDDNTPYNLELAAVRLSQGKLDEALRAYDNLERASGVNEEVTHQKQRIYIQQGKIDKAVQEAEKLMAFEPSDPDYMIELAELLIANERGDQAITYLERALKIDPDAGQAHVLLADIFRKKGDMEACNRELSAVFNNPKLGADNKVRVLSGYLAMLKGDEARDVGLKWAKELVKLHPKESKAYVLLADLLAQQGQKAEARDLYVKAAQYDKSVYQLWGAILQIDGELNQIDSLLKHSEQAMEYFPNQGLFWYSNGQANLIKRNYPKAIDAFEEGRKLLNDNEIVKAINAQLGDAYNGAGNHEKSDEAYELVLKDDPNNDHVLNNYSYYLSLRKEKLDIAKQMSEKLVERNPESATYLDTYAWVLYVAKEYEKARLFLEKAIQTNKDVSGTIMEHYGDVLYQLGDKIKAVEQWKKAKQIGENSKFIDQKIATEKLVE